MLQDTDDFLRGRGAFAIDAPAQGRLKRLLTFIVLFGFAYGVVMGSFSGISPGRYHQLLYSGVKAPALLFVTFVLCLPSFFMINTLLGLRDDFAESLRALMASQACTTIVLACLAPLTAFFYLSTANYNQALMFNGLMFAIASVSGLLVMRRYYAPLIQRSPTHRPMLLVWLALYVFVGIQMSWVLRPFVGSPMLPVAFFRSEAWGNAYVFVGRLIWNTVADLLP